MWGNAYISGLDCLWFAFKAMKCKVGGKDRGYHIIGAFINSSELIFYFGGTFEFREHNAFLCSVILPTTLITK